MTYPSDNFGGVPAQYQGKLTFVADPLYSGGGYYAAYARGRKFSFAEMEKLWDDAGGDPKLAGLMALIGENESGGYVGAWNSTGATSLWQIEYPGSAPSGVSRQNLFGARENATAAVDLSGNTLQGIQQNWAGDPALAPGTKIPNIPPASHVTGTGPPSGGGQQHTTNAGFPFAGFFGHFFTDPVDFLERGALIVFGGILIFVGIALLAQSGVRRGAREIGLLAPKKKGEALLTPEQKEDRERRLQLAEQNAAIGERRVTVKEQREERIGRVSRVHGGRTKGREPNPEPVHATE